MAVLLGALSGGTDAVDMEVVGGGPLVFVALGGTAGTSVALGAVGMLGMTGGAAVDCLPLVISGAVGVLGVGGASLPGQGGCRLRASSLVLYVSLRRASASFSAGLALAPSKPYLWVQWSRRCRSSFSCCGRVSSSEISFLWVRPEYVSNSCISVGIV